MKNTDFKMRTDGIKAYKLAEIFGKSTHTIQSYLTGRAKIPDEIALKTITLNTAIEDIKNELNKLKGKTLKKVIDGKLYNTETATHIAEYWNGIGDRDFRHVNEDLYRTKKGTFFLTGYGGPMTIYAVEKIIPLTEEDAKIWLEEHSDAETYIALFGEPSEA